MERLKVSLGGRHQSFKWTVRKANNPNHVVFHSYDWREAMATAVSLTHGNRPEKVWAYGATNAK